MPTPTQEAGNQDTVHQNVYPVLLHHYVPSFTGACAGVTPASAASTPHSRDVELQARFKVRRDKVCLILTYDPCKQVGTILKSTTTAGQQLTTSKETSPKLRSTKLNRSSGTGSHFASPKSKQGSPTFRKDNTTPTIPLDTRRHPKQYYVVELQEVSPLAAQLPLSAELRAHLRLNLRDGDAVTYSSHSTPRAAALSMSTGGLAGTSMNAATAAAALAGNFYFPPGRGPPVMSQRKRHDSPSAGFAAMTVPSYGQYLSADEPYRVHTRSVQTPLGKGGLGGRQHSSSFGEGDFTMIHESHPSSRVSSASGSPLLMPQSEMTSTGQTSLQERDSAFDEYATPQQLVSPTMRLDGVTDYAELLLVAFFGVVTSAGVPEMSFTTDPQGEVLVDKKKKKMGKRSWHQSLFHWFVPTKSADALPRRSVSTLSNLSGAVSSSTGSPQVSPSQPNPPATLPGKPTKPARTTSSSSAARKASSPVSAAAAHIDPQQVLELPFTLNKHDTFHLRFHSEDDLRRFLTRYVELQTRLREAERAKKADASSPLWHQPMRRATVGANRFGEEEEDEEEQEDDEQDSGSSGSSNDYPRNTDATGDGADAFPPDAGGDATRQRTGTEVTTPAPPISFFRGRGWEEFLRYHLDPRFGVPFAAFPLYLWHSYLPLAQLVLYTCYRGFLIVERVPPETTMSHSDEEVTAASTTTTTAGAEAGAAAGLTEPERTVEVGRQRLNALVNQLLTPIRTAQTPPRRPPPRTSPSSSSSAGAMNRHGVVEVLPLAPLPLADSGDEAYASSGSSSWDAVKLVLPSTDEAAGERNDDHFTTVKDVFLCVSESHLLFLNSFGRLRFQCSLDEIALITYSDATVAFPTYPFFRFRLKSSDYFGAPTFVLTFTLLPEVPHETGAATQEASPQAPATHTRTPSTDSAASSTTASDTFHIPSENPHMLAEDEKTRLLQRHDEFLRVFAAVCPRPLEFRTFAEMIAGELGRSSRIRFSHLTSAPQRKASGSPIVRFGAGQLPGRGTSWMALNYNANPILCVKVEADDIELYDTEVAGEGKSKRAVLSTTLCPSVAAGSRTRDTSLRRRSKASASPEPRCAKAPNAVTPRWGYDDPGIVLEDAGRDMDFSLEVATRTMPLLASKEEVHAGYGSNIASTQPSFHPGDHPNGDDEGNTNNNNVTDSTGGEEFFAPMAPKKKKSIILHRTAMEDAQ